MRKLIVDIWPFVIFALLVLTLNLMPPRIAQPRIVDVCACGPQCSCCDDLDGARKQKRKR